jgi:transcriptional regulator with XRE-family HTH domain
MARARSSARPPAPPIRIGERIAWARERAGLNKNRFARELGTSWQHVDHWEKGRTEPSLASLRRIAELLSVSLDFLLGAGHVPEAPPPSGLERFFAELAPPDLTPDEEEWLRRAPLDELRASPEDYERLLHGLRAITQHAPAATRTPSVAPPPKSGRRRKVDAEDLARAVSERRGGRA